MALRQFQQSQCLLAATPPNLTIQFVQPCYFSRILSRQIIWPANHQSAATPSSPITFKQ
jgi:hypothetical protein